MSEPPKPSRREPITAVTSALAAGALLAAAPLFVARGWVLERVALPIVEGRFSADGSINEGSVAFVDGLLGKAALGLVAAAVALFVWGRVGAAMTRRASGGDEDVVVRAGSWWLPALASLALVALAWPFMDRGFGYDEIFTTQQFVTTGSFWDTASSYKLFNNHIAYSLLARVAWLVTGETSEVALRVPALLLGVAAVFATWRLGHVLVGARAATVGTVLVAFSPSLVEWSSSARGYSGLIATTAWALAAYLELLYGRRTGRQFAVALALGAWFHLYAVLVGLGLGLHLVVTAWLAPRSVSARAVRDGWWALSAAAVATLVLFAPVLPRLVVEVLRRRGGEFRGDFPLEVLVELSGGEGTFALTVFVFGVVIAGVRSLPRRRTLAVLAVAGVPLALLWLVVQPFDLYGRFFAFLVPAVALLLGHGLTVPPTPRWLAAALTLGLAVAWWYDLPTIVDEEGYRAAARLASGADDTLSPLDAADALLALGGGGELFGFYTERPPLVPTDVAQLEDLVARRVEIRALHRPRDWEPAAHTAIAAWLATHGETHELGNARLYVWTP